MNDRLSDSRTIAQLTENWQLGDDKIARRLERKHEPILRWRDYSCNHYAFLIISLETLRELVADGMVALEFWRTDGDGYYTWTLGDARKETHEIVDDDGKIALPLETTRYVCVHPEWHAPSRRLFD